MQWQPQQVQPPQQVLPPQPPQPQQPQAAGAVRPPLHAQVKIEDTANVVAFTEGTDGGEFVIQTLVGEFIPKGENHGRPYYRKAPMRPGTQPPEVFLYFWDERDGPGFNGWWFGKSVGGNEVWSHNAGTGLLPPSRGWKIPFAGPVRETFCVTSKAAPNVQGRPPVNPEKEKKVQELGEAITKAITEAQSATEKAKTTVGGYSSAEVLKESEKQLAPYMALLGDLDRKLQAIGSSSEVAKTFGQKLRFAMSTCSAELSKIRMAIPKAMKAKQEAELEAKDRGALGQLMREVEAKAAAAEDLVEKTVITYAAIAQAGDDLAGAQKATDETEAAAKAAQNAIKEGLALIGAKLAVVRRYESQKVRDEAPSELNRIRDQLKNANQKLVPMLNAKQDLRLRSVAKQMADEVNSKIAVAEVAIDQAESAVTPLRAGAATPDVIKEAEVAIAASAEKITAAQAVLDMRIRTATGPVKEALNRVEESIRASHKRLDDIKSVHREVQERALCSNLLPEVGEKIHAVHQAVNSLESILSPIIVSDDGASLDDTLAAIKAGEEATKVATKAGSAAKICIAMKRVEVKRFTADAGQDAQRQLDTYQKELDVAMKKFNDLKAAAAESKQSAMRGEVEARVTGAEQLLQKAVDVFANLGDEAELLELPLEEVRSRGALVQEGQTAAQKAVREAQELITRRQIEAKGGGSAGTDVAMLKACQERLRTCQVEVAKFKSLPPIVEQQLALKQAIDEAGGKVSAAEEKVQQAASMVEDLNSMAESGSQSDDTKKVAEATQTVLNSAQVSLKGTARYLEVQQRVDKVPKDELVRLLERIKVAQERLDSLHTAMQEGSEKAQSRSLLLEVEQRVKEAEDTVEKASKVAAPFLSADAADDDGGDALNTLREAVAGGSKALGSAKTFLAVKKIAAKRLSANIAKASVDELTKLQARLDGAGKVLGELQKGTSDRKFYRLKQDALAKIKEVEAKADAFKALIDALEENEHKDTEPLEMKEIFEKAGACQQEAQKAIETVRPMLVGPLREAKPNESSLVAELKDILNSLKPIQEGLDVQKKRLSDREQKFVAKRLLKDAVQMFDELEAKLEHTSTSALPLTAEKPEEREDFAGAILLVRIGEALRQHALKAEQPLEALFEEMSSSRSKLAEEHFVSFVRALPELSGAEDSGPPPSEEQLKAAFAWLGPKGAEEVAPEEFLEQLRCRYFCTSAVTLTENLKLDGGKPLRKLEVREVVEALAEPEKDVDKGIMRVKVRAEKDGKEGYCTLSGNQGTMFLEPWSKYAECVQAVDMGMQETLECINSTMAYLKQKSEEISALQGIGALGEVKAELMKMRVRASKAQTTHSSLKKRVQEAQRRHEREIAEERQKRQERADKAAVAAMIAEVTEAVEALQAQLDDAAPLAEELSTVEGRKRKDPLQELEKAEAAVQAVLASINKGQEEVLKRSMEEIGRHSQKSAFAEAKRTMQQLAKKLPSMEARCKSLLASLHDSREKVSLEVRVAIAAALRAHAESAGLTPDGLFAKFSSKGEEVSEDTLLEALQAQQPEDEGSRAQLEMGLQRFGGVGRLGFLALFQDYKRCAKEIALTTEFSVKASTTVRKLEMFELVEALSKPDVDEKNGLTRMKCRACRDLAEGWVTLKGNQGTAFLEDVPKPFFTCEAADPCPMLLEACQTGSQEIRQLAYGEVFELLEGPRREAALEVARFRGRLLSSGQTGWVTLREPGPAGLANFDRVPLLVCRGSIAITSAFEISECVALRKLEVGEVLEQLGEPQQDLKRKLCRVHIRAKSDGKEGWATMKGNQGTVYLVESTSHYVCSRASPLEKDLTSGGEVLRQVEEGEILEVLEGPCTDSKQGAQLARGRALQGGDEGWFLVADGVRPWSAPHRCVQATDLRDSAEAASGTVLRSLDAGELLDALEAPRLDEAAGSLCMRLRAQRDGAVGFASVFLSGGARALEPAAAAFAAGEE